MAAVLTVILSGCTAVSLERHAANQAVAITELRYRLVLDNFARLARNSGCLPSLGTVSDGITTVSDSGTFDAKTGLDGFKGFTGETLSLTASRAPDETWTIDPVHMTTQIRAAKAAYQWVLFGGFPDPDQSLTTTLKDFQVYEALVAIPRGWVHVGREPTYR